MQRYVAFLRAINTPPRHVKMNRLRSIIEEAGFTDVATFIASGNVVFDASPTWDIVGRLEIALSRSLGFEVPVYIRTGREIVDVADLRPFDEAEDNLEISFLPAVPNPDDVTRLVTATGGSDRLVVVGREVYWSHVGPRSDSNHSEARVMRTLGMPTTQRSATTVRRITERYFR